MPKRAKTPPIEDDAKYLTVVSPYPAHPNMELDQHRREFARWIAACTGSFYLRAFYHKPTSPGSVIIEIDETFPDFKRLLGAHKWSEFLVDPGDEGRFESKMFYCTYRSDREVQKNGWKRVDVEDKWFKTKAPSKFVSPYPATHWCDVPAEKNVIHNPLCRPLPRADFPPPPPEPSPVVGTPEWQAWKQRQNAPRVVTAYTRGAPGATPAAIPAPVSRTASSRGSPGPRPIPREAWRNATAPLSPPGLPLGITRGGSSSGSSQRSTGGGSAWGEAASQRPASSSDTASGDDGAPVTPADADPHADATMVAGSHIEGPFAQLSMDDLDDEVYYSVNGDEAALGDGGAPDAPVQQFDYMLLPRADAVFVKRIEDDNSPVSGADEDEDDDEDAGDQVPTGTIDPKSGKYLCPEHNIVCRKGICLVYAQFLREKNREERRQEREKEKAERAAKREKNAKKKAKNSSFKDAPSSSPSGTASPVRSASRQPPPHLRTGAPPSSAARAPPAHLKAGAPPPPPPSSSARAMPAHLQRGVSAPGQPFPPPGAANGRLTPTPSRRSEGDDAQSASRGWGEDISEGPWGPVNASKKKASGARAQPPRAAPQAERAWGAWGKPPSISASSIRRNNDGWGVSDRSEAPVAARNGSAKGSQRAWGAWGKAPSISASSVRRNNDGWGGGDDARSVAAGSEAGEWGRPPSVVGAGDGPSRSWAEEMDDEEATNARAAPEADDDVRSVAASTESGWGNVSAGPW